jgi:ethanolamine ammonia-lyase large subunit
VLAGVAARDAVERVAARAVLADVTLADLRANPVVPYELDELTRLVEHDLDEQAYRAVAHLTVGQFREWLLDEAHGRRDDPLGRARAHARDGGSGAPS